MKTKNFGDEDPFTRIAPVQRLNVWEIIERPS